MTPTATAEIERLARASRPGEWRNTLVNVSERGIRTDAGYICFLPKPQHYESQDERYASEMAEYEATAAYIAAVSPDVVLGILADLRKAEQERDEFAAALADKAGLGKVLSAVADLPDIRSANARAEAAEAALRAAEAERDAARASQQKLHREQQQRERRMLKEKSREVRSWWFKHYSRVTKKWLAEKLRADRLDVELNDVQRANEDILDDLRAALQSTSAKEGE